MAEVSVKREVEVSAEKLWAVVEAFGDISWMPAGTHAELEGEGPGMARVIGAGDQSIREVLESCDADTRTLVYTIPENLPFPVTDYRSTMIVRESGGGSELEWSCSFEPDGVPEAEASATIEGMYGVMIGWVADRAKQG